MSAEQTYVVRRSDSDERGYLLYELTWLWRTGQLPHDAAFRDSTGAWRPVRELVEPILEREKQSAENHKRESQYSNQPSCSQWRLWLGGCTALLVVGAILWPSLRDKDATTKPAEAEERQSAEQERAASKGDFIVHRQILPGMTPEQVRRIVGPPKTVKATADASLERWFYKKEVVVFENGTVTGIEELP